MIQITTLTLRLLPSLLRLNGTFDVRLAHSADSNPDLTRQTGRLTVEQAPGSVRLQLDLYGQRHSQTLTGLPLSERVALTRDWIHDCANGRLERAA